jgi:quercetin dioxygenase-like cupin family protein
MAHWHILKNRLLGISPLMPTLFMPVHSHPHEQWSHVLEGELEFDIDGEKMLLTPGMTAYIPSNAPHSAVAHTQCKVIDCFTPPRQDFIELEKNTP